MKIPESKPDSGKKALDVPPVRIIQMPVTPPSGDAVLTREQAAKLKENVEAMRGYVIRVFNRMHQCRMFESRVYEQMKNLEDSLQRVWVTLHYTVCFGRKGDEVLPRKPEVTPES